MPSRFDNLWNLIAEPAMEREFGIEIIYTDHTRLADLTIPAALVTREEQARRPNSIGGWDLVTVRTARFATIAGEEFRVDGLITVDGKSYAVETIESIEGIRTQLSLRRVEVGELTRPDYRRTR